MGRTEYRLVELGILILSLVIRYGWRHQVKGWSQRGIRLIIPDTIGYTGSSQPTNPQEYALKLQSDDLEELVHQAGVPEGEKIILIAHDW